MGHVVDAVEVHGHDIAPVTVHVVDIGGDRVAARDARTVHQDRHRPDAIGDLRRKDEAGRPVGHVEPEAVGAAPGSADRGGAVGRAVRVHIEQHDMRRLLREGLGDRAADAHGGARYDSDVVLQKRHGFFPLRTIEARDAREAYLRRTRIDALTPQTETAPARLHAIFDHVRDDGYAIVDQELETGLRSIAVPVVTPTGVIAAVNVGTHASEVTLGELRTRFLPSLRRVAAQLAQGW